MVLVQMSAKNSWCEQMVEKTLVLQVSFSCITRTYISAPLYSSCKEMQQPSASVERESPSMPFDRTMDSVDLSLFLINSGVPREVCDVFESKFSVY